MLEASRNNDNFKGRFYATNREFCTLEAKHKKKSRYVRLSSDIMIKIVIDESSPELLKMLVRILKKRYNLHA